MFKQICSSLQYNIYNKIWCKLEKNIKFCVYKLKELFKRQKGYTLFREKLPLKDTIKLNKM